MKKLWRTVGTAFLMIAAAGNLAYGAGWQSDQTGWKWQKDDGTFLTSEWQWLDGDQNGVAECYYFDSNGYLVTGTVTADGCTVNEDGAWVADGIVQTQTAAPSDSSQDSLGALQNSGNAKIVRGQVQTSWEKPIEYYLLVPKNATENMPLVVYLHSGGIESNDLEEMKKETGSISEYVRGNGKQTTPAYVLMPRIPRILWWNWEEFDPLLKTVIDTVADERKVDRKRISITGSSLGAEGAIAMAADYPEMFSCVAPVGAYMLGGDMEYMKEKQVPGLKQIPVWFVSESDLGGTERAGIAVQAINEAGGNAEFTIVPNTTHRNVDAKRLGGEYQTLGEAIFPGGRADKLGILDWLISKSR